MNRRALRLLPIATCMTALAGFVDALGYLQLDGYYVSFMSGNSTRLSIGIAGSRDVALTAAALVALFVAGVAGGTLATLRARGRRPVIVLALVASLLAIGGVCNTFGSPRAAIACMAFAMGAENVAFQRDGRASVGLTYMTGALVKVGQGLAWMVSGRERWSWAEPLALWLGLLVGAALGTVAFHAFRLDALWFAVVAALELAFLARLVVPPDATGA